MSQDQYKEEEHEPKVYKTRMMKMSLEDVNNDGVILYLARVQMQTTERRARRSLSEYFQGKRFFLIIEKYEGYCAEWRVADPWCTVKLNYDELCPRLLCFTQQLAGDFDDWYYNRPRVEQLVDDMLDIAQFCLEREGVNSFEILTRKFKRKFTEGMEKYINETFGSKEEGESNTDNQGEEEEEEEDGEESSEQSHDQDEDESEEESESATEDEGETIASSEIENEETNW